MFAILRPATASKRLINRRNRCGNILLELLKRGVPNFRWGERQRRGHRRALPLFRPPSFFGRARVERDRTRVRQL